MFNENILFIWIFSIVIGCLVGAARGRVISGFVWSALLGPLGVVLVLCLPNLRKEAEDKKRDALIHQQIELQKAQLDKMQTAATVDTQSSAKVKILRIAKDSQDIGEYDIPKIKLMLRNRELTLEDCYFDESRNDWIILNECPDLATPKQNESPSGISSESVNG